MDKNRINIIAKTLMVMCFVTGLLSLTLFNSQVREAIINFGEKIIDRPLTHEVWQERLVYIEYEMLIFLFLGIIELALIAFGQPLCFSLTTTIVLFFRRSWENIKKSKGHGVELIALLVVLISLRCFYISQKKSLNLDEALSISICNRNEYGFWGKGYEIGREYTGKELKEISLWNNPDIKDSLADIFHMHQNNRDSPHTNFYYSIFRLWHTGVKTSDLRYIFWRGCLLNILFFVISFFFMTFLVYSFTNDSAVVCFVLTMIFANPISISLTVLLRPYELQQTCIIIMTYYVVYCFKTLESKNGAFSRKDFLIGICVLAFTMLSGYFAMIIIGLYGIVMVFVVTRNKDYSLLKYFYSMFFLSIILAEFLYFGFLNGFTDYRSVEAFGKFTRERLVNNTVKSFYFLFEIFFKKNIFIMVLSVFSFVYLLSCLVRAKKSFEARLSCLIFLIALISCLLISWFMPYKTLRYISPFLFGCMLVYTNGFLNIKINKVFLFAFVIFTLFALVPTKKNGQMVEHLDDANISSFEMIQKAEYPIFIRGDNTALYASLIPYISDGSKVIFVSAFEDVLYGYPKLTKFFFLNQLSELEIQGDNYEIFGVKKMTTLPYYDVYLKEK